PDPNSARTNGSVSVSCGTLTITAGSSVPGPSGDGRHDPPGRPFLRGSTDAPPTLGGGPGDGLGGAPHRPAPPEADCGCTARQRRPEGGPPDGPGLWSSRYRRSRRDSAGDRHTPTRSDGRSKVDLPPRWPDAGPGPCETRWASPNCRPGYSRP